MAPRRVRPRRGRGTSWIEAGAIQRGKRVMNSDLGTEVVTDVRTCASYRVAYTLTVEHEAHSFVAGDLITHNKMPAHLMRDGFV
jgi:hypothetical protein